MSVIPAVIHDDLTGKDEATLLVALRENLQRKGLNPVQEGRALVAYRDQTGMGLREMARALSKPPNWITRRLRLIETPGALEAYQAARLNLNSLLERQIDQVVEPEPVRESTRTLADVFVQELPDPQREASAIAAEATLVYEQTPQLSGMPPTRPAPEPEPEPDDAPDEPDEEPETYTTRVVSFVARDQARDEGAVNAEPLLVQLRRVLTLVQRGSPERMTDAHRRAAHELFLIVSS